MAHFDGSPLMHTTPPFDSAFDDCVAFWTRERISGPWRWLFRDELAVSRGSICYLAAPIDSGREVHAAYYESAREHGMSVELFHYGEHDGATCIGVEVPDYIRPESKRSYSGMLNYKISKGPTRTWSSTSTHLGIRIRRLFARLRGYNPLRFSYALPCRGYQASGANRVCRSLP